MSTIAREFTKEQLQQIIETDHVQCGEASSLERIARASLEAEPVAWLLSGGGAKNNVSFDSGNAYADPLREVTPLYTAPPAPVAVPSGYSDFEEIWSSSTHPLTQDDEMKDFAWDIWNACRAAMLQGADGNSPVIPDGWVACSERMPVENDIVLVVDDGYFVCEAQYRDGDFYSAARGNGEFFETTCRDVELWMPLPAAPQQEVK
ncbi:TPA: DUF551 domain-containing protein [Enterobacter cloacae]|nr:DUF551 domain-containing protein [Enterobacter cloacae]HEB0923063.1 DUF551 domain-containing protein [Enterobacter cloacae]HEB0928916.1 DUF551 domain-containing protein [Enterobacter cloacae]HEB0938072.1 DUF551 domain-containing protein [Enterobacter cloacae]HEB0943044.1 DUF551 domain-containing protein [Enterobacter cloacae]